VSGQSLAEFHRPAKAKPGALSYGNEINPASATSPHLSMELLKSMSGNRPAATLPYKGTAAP
jgi:tripartite-type tricarboxylate transporter receptor subunit TctC